MSQVINNTLNTLNCLSSNLVSSLTCTVAGIPLLWVPLLKLLKYSAKPVTLSLCHPCLLSIHVYKLLMLDFVFVFGCMYFQKHSGLDFLHLAINFSLFLQHFLFLVELDCIFSDILVPGAGILLCCLLLPPSFFFFFNFIQNLYIFFVFAHSLLFLNNSVFVLFLVLF